MRSLLRPVLLVLCFGLLAPGCIEPNSAAGGLANAVRPPKIVPKKAAPQPAKMLIGEDGKQALIGEDGKQALIGEDGKQALIGNNVMR